MNLFEITLSLATLLCTLIAGLVFGFATVIMPGLAALDDREYIRAFQVIDGVIQRGQPVFGLVWLGSILTLSLATAISITQLDGFQKILILISATVYLLGVQAPTFAVNVPLNNTIQRIDVNASDDRALASARLAFEPRWRRWNFVRTIAACGASVALLASLLTL